MDVFAPKRTVRASDFGLHVRHDTDALARTNPIVIPCSKYPLVELPTAMVKSLRAVAEADALHQERQAYHRQLLQKRDSPILRSTPWMVVRGYHRRRERKLHSLYAGWWCDGNRVTGGGVTAGLDPGLKCSPSCATAPMPSVQSSSTSIIRSRRLTPARSRPLLRPRRRHWKICWPASRSRPTRSPRLGRAACRLLGGHTTNPWST